MSLSLFRRRFRYRSVAGGGGGGECTSGYRTKKGKGHKMPEDQRAKCNTVYTQLTMNDIYDFRIFDIIRLDDPIHRRLRRSGFIKSIFGRPIGKLGHSETEPCTNEFLFLFVLSSDIRWRSK